MKKRASFGDLINGNQLVLVDFYTDWCGPCKAMKPIISEVAEAVREKAMVIKVNVDKNPRVAEQYQIRSIPTLMVFQQGQIKWRHAGMQSAYHLEQVINDLYQSEGNQTNQ